MIRKLLLGLMAAVFLAGPMLAADPQPIKPVAGAYTHARGHKDPPNLAQRHAVMGKRHKAIHDGLAATLSLPASYTCTSFCTPAEDQGQCGSCWDFSGTEVVESANIKAGYLPNTIAGQLSTQYTLDQCNGSNGGCDGDDNTTVLAAAKQGGLPLVTNYAAYQAQSENCSGCFGTPPVMLYVLSDWGYVDSQNGVAAVNLIKAALMQYGPIGTGVAAGSDWDNYQGGNSVITGPGPGVNHDVVITGWDDSLQAFQVRNSWGTSWGNNGYCWVAYTADQIGSEAVWSVAGPPVVLPSPNPPGPPSPVTLGPITLQATTYELLFRTGIFGGINAGQVAIPTPGQYTLTLTPATSKRKSPAKLLVVPTPARK
jgi:hypothetical protein